MLKVHKKEFQEWMGMISFTHNITIEPSASHPLSFDELCQRLRKVLFDINKKHLKSKRPFQSGNQRTSFGLWVSKRVQ